MQLIITGCEYVGKTTLAERVSQWIADTMGSSRSFHDHFTLPSPEVRDQDGELFMQMSPDFKERFQRYMIEYHLIPSFLTDNDHMLTGFHIEEAVFAPLYYGYGGEGQYAARSPFARSIEKRIMEIAPEMVLVLLRASPEAIMNRMKENPRPRDQAGRRDGILQEKDVEYALEQFDQEFSSSLIRRKFQIDNTDLTPEETLQQFVDNIKKHLSSKDQLRITTHQALSASGEGKGRQVAHVKTRNH